MEGGRRDGPLRPPPFSPLLTPSEHRLSYFSFLFPSSSCADNHTHTHTHTHAHTHTHTLTHTLTHTPVWCFVFCFWVQTLLRVENRAVEGSVRDSPHRPPPFSPLLKPSDHRGSPKIFSLELFFCYFPQFIVCRYSHTRTHTDKHTTGCSFVIYIFGWSIEGYLRQGGGEGKDALFFKLEYFHICCACCCVCFFLFSMWPGAHQHTLFLYILFHDFLFIHFVSSFFQIKCGARHAPRKC